MTVKLQFLGCGDASFLIDCGASSLIAMKQFGVAPNAIEFMLITHFHADHFGGVPFFMLDAQFFSKRRAPLTIAGPPGLSRWYKRMMETCFPGSSKTTPKFPLTLRELEPEETAELGGVRATPYPVNHGSGDAGPFFAYRIEAGGKTLAYTGDTEWVATIVPAAREADLFSAEAYFRDKKVMLHLDLATLEAHLDAIRPKRLILTHMSDDMLDNLGELSYETAEDGLVVTV